MADTHETTADIIAEKRRRADEIERDCAEKMRRGEMTSDQYARELVADIRREADRLEAACKRDKAAIEADALAVGGMVEAARKRGCGNCAKLREAALAIRADILKRRSENCWYATDSDILEKIDAALAAPPRNCDVYNNESCRMAYHLYGDGLMTMQAFADWLFAPATEKEGGAK